MDYYVYVDDLTNHARVHRGSCGHCNYGQGRGKGRKPDNWWSDPFASAELAMDWARATGKRNVAYCACVLRQRGA